MATILPGWNSIEAATKWHRGFEIAGFVALGLLLLFEIISYIYGNRKDVLLAAEQTRVATESRKQQQSEDKSAVDAANESARKAQEAEKRTAARAAEMDAKLAPRQINAEQQESLSKILKEAGPHSISVACNLGDREGCAYAKQFSDAFLAAGWDVEGGGVSQTVYDIAPKGLVIAVHDGHSPPVAATIIVGALKQIGLAPLPGVNKEINPANVELRIGTK